MKTARQVVILTRAQSARLERSAKSLTVARGYENRAAELSASASSVRRPPEKASGLAELVMLI